MEDILALEKTADGKGYVVKKRKDRTALEIEILPIFQGEPILEIGEYAFWSCSKITGVRIPDGVTKIGDSAFWGCTGLTEMVLPNALLSVGRAVFAECRELKSLVFPQNLTKIGPYAFSDCDKLKSVYYKGSKEDWRKIKIEEKNEELKSATRYYYSENPPTDLGRYWHYLDGKPIKW